ncbi:MAG: hypothetical protein AAGK21_05675, partial [Bacteroidota bacterium]
PGHVEQAMLREMRDVLDAWPASAPAGATVEAVEARAAEPRDVVDLGESSRIEAVLVDQSLDLLDRAPREHPPAGLIASVEAFAAQVSALLAAVRHVYEGADAPAAVAEVALLRQSRQAIERSIAEQPPARPSHDAVEAVLARAAEASGIAAEPLAESPAAEAVLLAQSTLALDRLPRYRPSAEARDAVRLAAASATAAAGTPAQPVSRAAADRGPLRSSRRSPVALWAGAGTLLVAAIAAVVLLPGPDAEIAADATQTAAVETPPQVSAPVAEAPQTQLAPSPDLPPTAPAGGALAATAPIAGFVPVIEGNTPPAPRRQLATDPPAVEAEAAGDVAPPPAWEAGDDVRALSLRLQDLDPAEGLDWDEAAEAFGVPAGRARTTTATPGVRVVREGAPPTPAPRAEPAPPAEPETAADSSSAQQ